MPCNQSVQTIPPPAPKKVGKAINLYLRPGEIAEIDAIAKKMEGTRSDAIRWFLELARDAMKGRTK